MSDLNLKPCNFCGCDMESVALPTGLAGPGLAHVTCDCGAMGPGGKTAAEAIAAWNRRATQPASAPADERLSGLLRGLEAGAVAATWPPHVLFALGQAIATQAKKAPDATAAPQGQAEPVTGDLLDAANAVVERRHTKDWKQPHTVVFIERLAAAVGAAKAAPAQPTQAVERDGMWPKLLEAVLRELPKKRPGNDGNAPGHCHSIPGIWDSDNGARAGTECAWCLAWNAATAAIAAMTKEAT